jgi:flagellar basal body rod protein FlgG
MDGIELMATAMHAAKARLDVSAGNLANVSSEGFCRRVARTTLGSAGLVAASAVDASAGGSEERLRSASFERDDRGRLRDARGNVLLGARGPLTVPADATFDSGGTVRDGAGHRLDQLRLTPGASVQSGFLEGPNVDAVHEMVDILDAQRSFETAQKTLSALDAEREKDANDVGRVKA